MSFDLTKTIILNHAMQCQHVKLMGIQLETISLLMVFYLGILEEYFDSFHMGNKTKVLQL